MGGVAVLMCVVLAIADINDATFLQPEREHDLVGVRLHSFDEELLPLSWNAKLHLYGEKREEREKTKKRKRGKEVRMKTHLNDLCKGRERESEVERERRDASILTCERNDVNTLAHSGGLKRV